MKGLSLTNNFLHCDFYFMSAMLSKGLTPKKEDGRAPSKSQAKEARERAPTHKMMLGLDNLTLRIELLDDHECCLSNIKWRVSICALLMLLFMFKN